MRMAIVHHLAGETALLRRIAESAGHQVCWTATCGQEALDRCAAETPELLLLDVGMHGMDVSRTTCSIMKRSPCAILLVAPSVPEAAAKIFEAMGCGALDAVATPPAA